MAWRARIHYLTRSPQWIGSVVLCVLGLGLGIALLVISVKASPESVTQSLMNAMLHDSGRSLKEEYQKLLQAPQPDVRNLARWLRRALYEARLKRKSDPAKSDTKFDFDALFEGKLSDPTLDAVFANYVQAASDGAAEDRLLAAERLADAAFAEMPPPLANQLYGQLLVQERQMEAAVEAFMREGRQFPDATSARAEALHWAVHLRQTHRIKDMLVSPEWIRDSDPAVVYHAAVLTGNVWLQWQMLLHLRLKKLPWLPLGLGLMAIGLWYVILVQWSGQKSRWRWFWPVLPLIAGVASIWPTVFLIEFQTQRLGLSADNPFPHNLWYFYGGIALREELCKLALFSLFLPWLLKRRQAGLALITGAFVGLGFALEENLDYYDPAGGSVVWSRFMTANFLHAALSGIAGLGLYQAVRSKFHRVSDFLGALALVVAAHGTYDLVLVYDLPDVLGIGFFAIIILAFLANQFFSLLAAHQLHPRGAVAPGAVFAIGSAILVATLFVAAAVMEGTRGAVADVGMGCAGMVPVGVLFWKHLAS